MPPIHWNILHSRENSDLYSIPQIGFVPSLIKRLTLKRPIQDAKNDRSPLCVSVCVYLIMMIQTRDPSSVTHFISRGTWAKWGKVPILSQFCWQMGFCVEGFLKKYTSIPIRHICKIADAKQKSRIDLTQYFMNPLLPIPLPLQDFLVSSIGAFRKSPAVARPVHAWRDAGYSC